mmetsp:Transcript_57629/g.137030  ORF Transcript_57629/g.137030 Transcript_57629/m.137030 type:complete len:170 (-) Transcript_57629:54-563(-)
MLAPSAKELHGGRQEFTWVAATVEHADDRLAQGMAFIRCLDKQKLQCGPATCGGGSKRRRRNNSVCVCAWESVWMEPLGIIEAGSFWALEAHLATTVCAGTFLRLPLGFGHLPADGHRSGETIDYAFKVESCSLLLAMWPSLEREQLQSAKAVPRESAAASSNSTAACR